MSERFDIIDVEIKGLKIIQRKPICDSRGYLERLFCAEEFEQIIPDKKIIQINHTLTEKCGSIRGMHFQYPPYSEAKFVMCTRGEVFDVAVDLRFNSPTFLRWHAEVLSPDKHNTFLIPEGFAHGFQTLTDHCELIYFHTAPYQSHSEGTLNALDPKLSISWPLSIDEQSIRDKNHPMIDQYFNGITL